MPLHLAIEVAGVLLACLALGLVLRHQHPRHGAPPRRAMLLLVCVLLTTHLMSVIEHAGVPIMDRFIGLVRMVAPILWLLLFDAWIKQQARDKLAESEERYRTIVEDQSEFVARWTPDGTYTFINEAYARYLNTTPQAMVGVNFLDTLPSNEKTQILQLIALLSVANPVVSEERFKVLPDGREVWQNWTNRGIFDKAGKLVTIQAWGQDITQRIEAERARTEMEHLLSLALEGAHLGLWDWHLPTGHTKYSDRWCRMLGFEPDEVEPSVETWRRLVHPQDKPRAEQSMQALLRGEVPYYQAEYRIRTKRGQWKWVMVMGSVIERDAAGEPVRVVGVPMDIDDRKRAAAEIERWKNRYEIAIVASGQIMYDWNSVTNEVTIAGAVERVLGCTAEELATLEACVERVHPEDRPKFIEQVNDLKVSQEPLKLEYRVRHQDGHYLEVEDHGFVIRSEADESIHMLGVIIDVSERKAAERRRIQTGNEFAQKQKMEAIGHLAAGIAHDFSNLLTAIQGHLALAYRGMQADHPALRSLKMVEQAAQQGVDMTRSITAFVHKQPAALEPCNLNDIASESARMFRHLLPTNISVDLSLPAQAPWTYASRSQLQQVVMNLILNARDAMPQGGSLKIKVQSLPRSVVDQWPALSANHELDRDAQTDEAQLPVEQKAAVLSVIDTGSGMSEHVMTHIFEPFFTTKDRQHGTGLGMAMVHGVVTESGGSVHVASVVDHGSRIDIVLPQTDKPAPPQDRATAATNLPPRRPRHLVLLHPRNFVSEIMITTLESSGYVVRLSDSFENLLKSTEELGDEVSALVIADDLLPEAGDDSSPIFTLREQLPDVPLVVLTAKAASYLDEPAARLVHLLARPFQMSRLVELVDRACGIVSSGAT